MLIKWNTLYYCVIPHVFIKVSSNHLIEHNKVLYCASHGGPGGFILPQSKPPSWHCPQDNPFLFVFFAQDDLLLNAIVSLNYNYFYY